MILMAMTTYPLNNILYQAEDAELFHCTRTSGVYDNLDFQYSVTGADNNVTIGKGLAWIRNAEFAGKVSANKQPIVLDLGLTSSVLPRIDAIVIQFDANKNATSIIVKKGEEASQPQAPKVVRTEAIYELHLYHVLRKPSDATITEGVITDLRTNYDYCGIMLDDISRIDQTLKKDGFAADSGVVGRLINGIVDYPIEIGTLTSTNPEHDIWDYVKWKSGRMELSTEFKRNTNFNTSFLGGFRNTFDGTKIQSLLPKGTLVANKKITGALGGHNRNFVFPIETSFSGTGINAYFCCDQKGTFDTRYFVEIEGFWK